MYNLINSFIWTMLKTKFSMNNFQNYLLFVLNKNNYLHNVIIVLEITKQTVNLQTKIKVLLPVKIKLSQRILQ